MPVIVKIQNVNIAYNDIQISLRYDSIASIFSFNVYYDPTNPEHKRLFRPLSWHQCKIYYQYDNGKIETLVTGMLVIHKYRSEAAKQWVNISGYSITGVLENSSIANFPIQYDGLTIKQIAEKICQPFGLSVVVDKTVTDACNQVANIATADIKQTCKEYISEICSQKSIVVSHTPYGQLLLTSIKTITTTVSTNTSAVTTGIPVDSAIVGKKNTELQDNKTIKNTPTKTIYDFADGNAESVSMELTTNGQSMHSQIIVLGQAGEINSRDSVANNPYVVSNIPNNNALNTWRPKILIQTFGTDIDTVYAADNARMQELKNIALTVNLRSWFLNGVLVKPNYMITVLNKDIFLFKKTRFFIESVVLTGDEKGDTAILNCVLPEAYDRQIPHNVFN